MSEIRQIAGRPVGHGKRIGIVATRFNEHLVESLLDGAVDTLVRSGVSAQDLTIVRVPGAWEAGSALRALARLDRSDALVLIGVVIRGETPHFDYICREASRASATVASESGIPVGFGLLTCDTTEQAQERAGGKVGNKGREAALAALEMIDVLDQLQPDGDSSSGS